MNRIKCIKMNILILAIISLVLNSSCHQEIVVDDNDSVEGEGLADWTTQTHSDNATPDYSMVFPQERVNRIDIVFAEDEWEAMLQDMTNNLGAFGTGGGNPPPPPPPPMLKSFGSESGFTPVFQPASVFMNAYRMVQCRNTFQREFQLALNLVNGLLQVCFPVRF
jgi:spore coat protein H